MQSISRMMLGIILLNWNNTPATTKCVLSLRTWRKIKPLVYVVNNGSADEDLHFSEDSEVPVFLIQSPGNLGYAGGNNRGIRMAIEDGCEYVLLLNNDASVGESELVKMLDMLEGNLDIGCIGPEIHEGNRVYLGGRNIGFHVNTRNTRKWNRSGKTVLWVSYIPGMVFLARRDAIKKIGCLDETFFFSGEIADFCLRAIGCGYKCAVCTVARAEHEPDKDHPLRRTLYQYYSLRNRFLFIRKHYPGMRWIMEPFWILWGVQRYIRAFIKGQEQESDAYRMGIMDGLKGRYGDRNELFLL